jgi:ribosome biogenesis GTPase
VLVASREGARIPCTLLGRRIQAVCGDEVLWRHDATPTRGIVVERLPRRSALTRTNSAGSSETLVANLSQLVVLFASEPTPDFFIVDRYLAAAELLGLDALVVRNKRELPDDGTGARELQNYARIGYRTVETSAKAAGDVAALEPLLRGAVSVLVGQSGVGKSSLANRLLPGLEAETAELSRATEEGRHVTSVSTLHHLPAGGDLVDSPGVRDFAPAIELLGDPERGFREIAAARPGCRFSDCKHLREPDCAVRRAVDGGEILARRYESYRRLRRLSEELAPEPGRAREKRRRVTPDSD